MTIDTGRATRVSGDGDATARRFLLMTGWGLDAAAIDGIVRSPRRRWLKRKFGEPTYFLSAVREAMRRSWGLRLRVDGGEPYEVEMGMFTVGNTRMIGTWLEVNATASAVDGQLDAILVHGAPWRALTLAGFARGGLIAKLPGVSTLRFRTLDVEPIGRAAALPLRRRTRSERRVHGGGRARQSQGCSARTLRQPCCSPERSPQSRLLTPPSWICQLLEGVGRAAGMVSGRAVVRITCSALRRNSAQRSRRV